MIPTRLLGKTGQKISILGFGTAAAGKRLKLKVARTIAGLAQCKEVLYKMELERVKGCRWLKN